MHAELTGDRELDRFFQTITPKLQRGALRKGVSAGGTALVRAIRDELKSTPFKDSRGATVASRRAAREAGQKPLMRTIGKRAWSVPEKGIIGQIVGPKYPEGAHAHLVERGHRIVTTHAAGHRDTGRRTDPIPFMDDAERKAKNDVRLAVQRKLAEALKNLKAR